MTEPGGKRLSVSSLPQSSLTPISSLGANISRSDDWNMSSLVGGPRETWENHTVFTESHLKLFSWLSWRSRPGWTSLYFVDGGDTVLRSHGTLCLWGKPRLATRASLFPALGQKVVNGKSMERLEILIPKAPPLNSRDTYMTSKWASVCLIVLAKWEEELECPGHSHREVRP